MPTSKWPVDSEYTGFLLLRQSLRRCLSSVYTGESPEAECFDPILLVP